MRFLRQSLSGLLLLSVTFGLLVWAGSLVRDSIQARLAEESFSRPARERVVSVNVITAEPREEVPVLQAFGEVGSSRSLELRASTAGQVVELAPGFEDGARVTAGTLLARIDPAAAQDALARAEADVIDATAEIADAETGLALAMDELAAAEEQESLRERAFARQADLSQRGVGTEAAVEQAELSASSARQAVLTRRQAIAQAQARLAQAKTTARRAEISLAEAQRELADTEIYAPFDGTLSEVSLVEGGLVSSNERLGVLVDPNALEVAFRVSVEAYARLIGEDGLLRKAPVKISLDVLGVDLVNEGQLVRDSAAVAEGQTGRLLYARIDGGRGLKPGDFVTVEVAEEPIPFATRLPSLALNSASELLVLGDEDRLETFEVNLLRRQGDEVLVRARGLRGKQVVAERTPLLGDGIKVKPLQQGADTAPEAPEMVTLTEERKAKIRAFVEANKRMPEAAKARILAQLDEAQVPAQMVARIESRMGG